MSKIDTKNLNVAGSASSAMAAPGPDTYTIIGGSKNIVDASDPHIREMFKEAAKVTQMFAERREQRGDSRTSMQMASDVLDNKPSQEQLSLIDQMHRAAQYNMLFVIDDIADDLAKTLREDQKG